MKQFNLNNNVRVKLTDLGKQMIVDYYTQHDKNADRAKVEKTMLGGKIDANGYTELQMSELMTYFGGAFSGSQFSGGTKRPFETMNVLIDDKNLVDVKQQGKQATTKEPLGIEDR